MKKPGFVEHDNITLLAKGVLLRGEIRVEGTVRIDGRLEGDLHTAGTVVVGEDGVVQGTITAGTLISSGKIKANVRAMERVQLLKTGVLVGEVHTPAFAMEDGAKFRDCPIWASLSPVRKGTSCPTMSESWPCSGPRRLPPWRRMPDRSSNPSLLQQASAVPPQSNGIVIVIPPITSFSAKSRLGLSGWWLWHFTQAMELARSA